MNLDKWALRWRIPPEAVAELCQYMGVINTDPSPQAGESEAAIQTRVRLDASRKGGRLWRNNVGVLKDERGVPVRYGLANESKQMNETIKSSDLIGIKPVTIKPKHVGLVIGQFTAREVKPANWKYTGIPREVAQLKWLELILSLGGDAKFVNRC